MKKLKRGVTPGAYIETVSIDRSRIYDPLHYAFQLPVIRHFEKLDLHPQVTFLLEARNKGVRETKGSGLFLSSEKQRGQVSFFRRKNET